MAGIISWGCYIPRYRITVEEIAKSNNKDANQIKKSLMISEKSLPSEDEDTATIAVEAARNAISCLDSARIGAIYVGSESHPYSVKPTGTIVGEALDIGNEYTTADFEFACKAGTAAIQVSLGLVKSRMVEHSLAGGCDAAQSAPGDALEYTAAAGGALFLIGNDNTAADINETVSFTSDTPDFWRRKDEKYPNHAGAFTGKPAYYKHVISATRSLMEKSGSKPEDYDFAVFHQPNGKFPRRAAKKLGFTEEQIEQGMIVERIGNTYSGSSLIGLCSVLDIAEPGQRILLTSYGSGAGSDSFDITTTENIKKIQKKARTVDSFIKNKKYVQYSEYARLTGKIR